MTCLSPSCFAVSDEGVSLVYGRIYLLLFSQGK